MLQRTQPAYGIRAWQKTMGGARSFQVEPPYYLKHSPGNPWLGVKHDGTEVEYGRGFQFKPIHWLYRFRWNSQHRGAGTLALRNPGGKCPHWLEVSQWKKLKPHLFNYEALPHTILLGMCCALVAWNLFRYVFFHPDLTIFNIIFFTMRHWVNVLRNQEIHTMDQPTFRWFQVTPEFYGYNPMRDMMEMGLHANDPYLEYMKSIGREKELFIRPPFGIGESAPGKIRNYLPKTKRDDKEKWINPVKPPRHWYAGPHGTGPHGSHGHGDHGDDHGHGHGGHDDHGAHGDDHGHGHGGHGHDEKKHH